MIFPVAIRLILADDSYIIREGVRELVRGLDGIEVVAVCSDFDSLNDAIAREGPDVVLTDIRMPPSNTDEGIRMADALRRAMPGGSCTSSGSTISVTTGATKKSPPKRKSRLSP